MTKYCLSFIACCKHNTLLDSVLPRQEQMASKQPSEVYMPKTGDMIMFTLQAFGDDSLLAWKHSYPLSVGKQQNSVHWSGKSSPRSPNQIQNNSHLNVQVLSVLLTTAGILAHFQQIIYGSFFCMHISNQIIFP